VLNINNPLGRVKIGIEWLQALGLWYPFTVLATKSSNMIADLQRTEDLEPSTPQKRKWLNFIPKVEMYIWQNIVPMPNERCSVGRELPFRPQL
jgi:hypothetical protein